MESLNRPPSQMVFSLPGIPHSHTFRSRVPAAVRAGLAQKPNGWSLRHCLLCLCQPDEGHVGFGASEQDLPLLLQSVLAQRHVARWLEGFLVIMSEVLGVCSNGWGSQDRRRKAAWVTNSSVSGRGNEERRGGAERAAKVAEIW